MTPVQAVSSNATVATRLASLDVFRGLTLASMVLVNNPGSWSYIYRPLEHAEWNGWTFTDTVFPFFLWIVGVALTLSFARRVERGDTRGKLFLHVLRRAVILFAIGLFLNGFPYFSLASIRYPGVLQRIAVCYLVAASIFLFVRVRGIVAITAALLISYWLLMTLVPVPGCGRGNFSKECNLAKYIDGIVLSGHMWSQTKTWDPEGILSTIPAIATTLFGILMGYLVRSKFTPAEKTVWMFVMGILLLWAGSIINNWLPINKNLWTSSYSVFMAGLASIVFALCHWTVDVLGYRRWMRPFAIYGMNAIAVFTLTGVIGRSLDIVKIGAMPLETWIYNNMFLPLASPVNASLLYAIANVLFYYAVVYFMYRRGWFIRF